MAVLGFAAIAMAATSAVLSWHERDFRGACTNSARLAAAAQDVDMQRNGITVMLRDARESIAVLRQIREQGGACAKDADNALQGLLAELR